MSQEETLGLVELTVPEKNFKGTLCGFTFADSVCRVSLRPGMDQVRLRRLLGLKPGATVKSVGAAEAAAPEKAQEAAQEAPKAAAPAEDTPAESEAQEGANPAQEQAVSEGEEAAPEEAAPEAEEDDQTEAEEAAEEGPVDLDALDRDGLKAFIAEHELDVKVSGLSDDDVRVAIANALNG